MSHILVCKNCKKYEARINCIICQNAICLECNKPIIIKYCARRSIADSTSYDFEKINRCIKCGKLNKYPEWISRGEGGCIIS